MIQWDLKMGKALWGLALGSQWRAHAGWGEGMVVTACVTSFLWLERILKDFPVKFHKQLRNETRVSSLS